MIILSSPTSIFDRFDDESFKSSNFLPFHTQSYGLDSDNIPRSARTRNAAGGFVDLGNESEYAANGYQPSSADEVFADEQGDKPW